MPEYTVAHILDPHETGARFTMWPLHVTVVPPFEAPDLESVLNAFEPVITATPSVFMHLGGLAKFGANRTVQKLVPSTELSMLHGKLLETGEQEGWKLSGRYTGERFTPHITRKAGRLYSGTGFLLDSLAVVEAQSQGYRQIKAELSLKGRDAA